MSLCSFLEGNRPFLDSLRVSSVVAALSSSKNEDNGPTKDLGSRNACS